VHCKHNRRVHYSTYLLTYTTVLKRLLRQLYVLRLHRTCFERGKQSYWQ